MRKSIKMICAALTVSMLFCSLAACGGESKADYPVKLKTVYNGKEVDLAVDIVRRYIRFKDDEDRLASMLYEQLNKSQSERIFGDRQNISFSWEEAGKEETFTLYFAKDKEFKDILFTYQTQSSTVTELGVFIPGETYYYKVVGSVSGESMVDSFKAKDLPVRYISAGAVLNMRDLGGWTTKDGKKVKYGLLYRGGALDGTEHPELSPERYIQERGTSRLDEMGMKVFTEYLGMKGEIDLRGVPEDQHLEPAFGGDPKYLCQYPGAAASVLWSNPDNATLKAALKTYFSFLANEDNYPIYFHCNGGADRTGALAFLILGVLGVDYTDVAVDYELTSYSFAAGGIRKRSQIGTDAFGNAFFQEPNDLDPAVGYCRKVLLQKYPSANGDLQKAIEEYLTSACGVTAAEIASLKSIMLEG